MFKIPENCKKLFTSIVLEADSLDPDCQKWAIDNLTGFELSQISKFTCLVGNHSFINYTVPSLKEYNMFNGYFISFLNNQ